MELEKNQSTLVQQDDPGLPTPDHQLHSKVDGGKDAWIALAGAFVLEAVIWGFPGAFGVFQEYYADHEPFESNPSGLPAISTTANGVMYLASPVIGLVLQRCPQFDRFLGLLGLAIMTAALTAASFSNSTGALIGTQGALYAVGGLTAYFPAIYVVDGWFVARKGFAFGVVLTGTGVGGAVLPFLCQWLLDNYGFRTTLRTWTVIQIILVLPSVIIMKRRKSDTAEPSPSRDLSFLWHPPFWIFELGNICMSLSFFLPSIYIPSFAMSIGLPTFAGPLAICLMNVAACFGYLLHGYLVDLMDVTIVIGLSAITTSLSIFVFWGLSTSQPLLYIFAVIWGISGGGYAATWSGCGRSLRRIQSLRTSLDQDLSASGDVEVQSIDNGFVISLMCAGKGVGSLISGPVSEMLVREGGFDAGFAYGGEYGSVIVFAGVLALLGGLAAVGKGSKLL